MAHEPTPRATSSRRRGPVVWYGGKGRVTGWLKTIVPVTPVYVEPYGGAAALLFARDPVAIEVYNDLDGRLANLFRALQDPRRKRRLEQRLRCTFYARADFELALGVLRQEAPDPDDLAWAFFVAQNQSFGGIATNAGNWARTRAGNTSRPRSWWSRVDELDGWAQRLAGVQIEQRPALEVIRGWDARQATFYIDPPYVHDTRRGSHEVYAVEASDDDHQALVDALLRIKGACVLSGYAHPLYVELERAGWQHVERDVVCRWKGNGPSDRRIEAIWRNPRAVELCP
jgi:DNA adenine methylase